jgi:hypothetical protein
VRVGAHERVGEGRCPTVLVARGDDRGEELEVHLVDDARARRHDAEVAQRGLRPAQQLVTLAVALVLAGDVEGEGVARAVAVDLDRVIDDEVRRHERVDARRVAAEVGHRVAHRGEVDDRGHAGEVLEEDARGHEGHLDVVGRAGSPGGHRGEVGLGHDASTRVAQNVLEQDLHGHGQALEVRATDGVEPVDAQRAVADAKRRARGGRVGGASAVHAEAGLLCASRPGGVGPARRSWVGTWRVCPPRVGLRVGALQYTLPR